MNRVNLTFLLVVFLAGFGFNSNAQKFEWAKQIESLTSQVISYDIAVDNDGFSYITGYFTGITDFDPSQGTIIDTAMNQGKTFVAKYSSSGEVIWAKFLNAQGSGKNFGSVIHVYGDNLFIGGGFGAANTTDTTDFDPGIGEFKLVPANFNDPFVLKLDTAGNFVKVAHFVPQVADPGASCIVQDLTISQNGDVISVGRFKGTLDFDPGPNLDVLASNGGDDFFVVKLDVDLNHQWAYNFGSTGDDYAHGVALDPNENICLTGGFSGLVDFDPSTNTENLQSTGLDAYISKLTPQGDLIWVRQFSGSNDDIGRSITVDASGGIYTVGTFFGSLDFDPGPGTVIVNAGTYYNSFVCKVDANGDYQWGYQIGDGTYSRGFDIASDVFNNVYIAGDFQGLVDINVGPQIEYFETYGFGIDEDMFMMKLDQNGNYNWAKQIGSPNPSDICWGITVDSTLNVYSTGSFSGTADFDTGQDTLFFYPQFVGTDSYLHKMGNCTQTFSSISEVACDSYLPPSGKILYTQSGIYNDVIDNSMGCDSVITIDLTIVPTPTPSQINVNLTNCDYYVSPSGNYTFATSGVYIDTVQNFYGCDSIITINLTTNITLTSIAETACEGYSSPSGNYYWVNSGVYYDTLMSSAGCDSIIEVDLTINPPSFLTMNITACDQYTSPSGNQVWTSSGVYQDTLLNANNCDSILTVDLLVLNSTTSFQNVTSCDGYLSPSGLNYWTSSGMYVDTIQNSASCDSIITFNLFISPSDMTFLNVTGCGEYLSPSGLYVWNSSGVYADTLSNVNGCDSILMIDLELLNTSSTQNITICDGYLSPSGSNYWTTSGVYQDTIQNSSGCDSIITIMLIVDSLVATVNQIDAVTLEAGPSTGDYQWFFCADGLTPIAGATSQMYTAVSNGSYAVVVADDLCSDTSDCIEITDVGLFENNLEASTIVYPNPTNKNISVLLPPISVDVQIMIRNVLGEVTYREKFNSQDEISFECVGPAGCYTIEISSDQFTDYHRIVKL